MYLDDPARNCRLAKLTDDEGQDGAGCHDDEDLGHDSESTLDELPNRRPRIAYAKQHTKTTTHDLHDRSTCLTCSVASCSIGTIRASVCDLP
jgi:hypothetical protein